MGFHELAPTAFQIGEHIDCRDSINKWCNGEIVAVSSPFFHYVYRKKEQWSKYTSRGGLPSMTSGLMSLRTVTDYSSNGRGACLSSCTTESMWRTQWANGLKPISLKSIRTNTSRYITRGGLPSLTNTCQYSVSRRMVNVFLTVNTQRSVSILKLMDQPDSAKSNKLNHRAIICCVNAMTRQIWRKSKKRCYGVWLREIAQNSWRSCMR